MIGPLVLAAVVSASSLVLYAVGRRRAPRPLTSAAAALLHCLGLAAVFVVLNGTLGIALIAGIRLATGRFVTPYLLDDPVWLVVSLLQAMLWSFWRGAAAGR